MIQEISNKKVKGEIGIFFVIQYATLLQTFFCNTFSKWCRILWKMMDVHALLKYCVLLQKVSKLWNRLRESIYFLVTITISCFGKQRFLIFSNSASVRSHFIVLQKSCTFFASEEKVLTKCGPKLNPSCSTIFFSSSKSHYRYNYYPHDRK